MKNTTLSCGFDALIIAGKEKAHDSSIVDGVVLDVFVYPAETFSADYDPVEFVQVWDGKIVLDEHGIAGQLKAKVLREFDRESLSAWIDYLKSMVNIRPDGTLTR
ncbi:hypothetical protein ACTNEA_06700 [Oscillospiraceae bacterium HCP3S3_F4]